MQCGRCGSEIHNVPEHLRDLADWVCQQCTNTAPRRSVIEAHPEPAKNQAMRRGKQAA